jgi:hypothetical protein
MTRVAIRARKLVLEEAEALAQEVAVCIIQRTIIGKLPISVWCSSSACSATSVG